MAYEFKLPTEEEKEFKKRTCNFEVKFEDTQFKNKEE